MEMDVIDTVAAYTLEVGDHIIFDSGSPCKILKIDDDNDEGIVTLISDDDREISFFWWNKVDIYGYSEVDI